jgi:hypothetical protein
MQGPLYPVMMDGHPREAVLSRPLCCISPEHKQKQPHATGTRKKPCPCLVLGSCTYAELLQQRGGQGLKKASRPERIQNFQDRDLDQRVHPKSMKV